MIALLVLGPERMLTLLAAVLLLGAVSSVTTAILSRDARALNSFSFEHHFKSPSRPVWSAQSQQSQKSQKPQLAQDSNGVSSVTARSPVNLFWNFKPTRRLRPDNFTDVIRSGRGSCLCKVLGSFVPALRSPM